MKISPRATSSKTAKRWFVAWLALWSAAWLAIFVTLIVAYSLAASTDGFSAPNANTESALRVLNIVVKAAIGWILIGWVPMLLTWLRVEKARSK